MCKLQHQDIAVSSFTTHRILSNILKVSRFHLQGAGRELGEHQTRNTQKHPPPIGGHQKGWQKRGEILEIAPTESAIST